jgi:peptidoglycan/LPS O-acetylase OafA/YrhL
MTFSPEIQGLRGVAVLLVVVFHALPVALPGGYVGVDVFFVISGYLITGILFGEYSRHGKVDIAYFYARRIRRLMPAAAAVVAAVLLVLPWLPALYWEASARQALASLFYCQNWYLSLQALDYLGAEEAASPFQHFWSLSIEEQYYALWPLLIALGAIVLRVPARHAFSYFAALLLLIGAGSLAWSVWLTEQARAAAYFSTFTRAWELALGGALAITTSWRGLATRWRARLAVAGLFAILLAGFGYDRNTPFPGIAALLPTAGAALIIVSSAGEPASRAISLLRSGVLRYLGDISYSLYLWHWPVVIVAGVAAAGLGRVSRAGIIIALSIGVAHLSKRYIEDPGRGAPQATAFVRRSLIAGALLVSLPAALAVGWLGFIATKQERLAAVGQAIGSAALSRALMTVVDDKPEAYDIGCHANQRAEVPSLCRYGERGSGKRVMLIGDSHALQWTPAFRALAMQRGWDLVVMTKSACAFGPVAILDSDNNRYHACEAWNRGAMQMIQAFDPSLVVVTQSRGHRAYGTNTEAASSSRLVSGLEELWERLIAEDRRVVALRDTPWMAVNVPECLAINLHHPAWCDRPRSEVAPTADDDEPVWAAASRMPQVIALDFTDAICHADVCPAIRDGYIVWRDPHHLTASYARHLAGAVADAINRAGVVVGEGDVTAQEASARLKAASVAAASLPAHLTGACYNVDEAHSPGCVVGDTQSTREVLLVGDSRAGQWLDALDRFGRENGYRVRHIALQDCILGGPTRLQDQSARDAARCEQAHATVRDYLSRHGIAALLLSQSVGYKLKDFADWRSNSARLRQHAAAFVDGLETGPAPVVVFADTPRFSVHVPHCISTNRELSSLACRTTRRYALDSKRFDPLVALAAQRADIRALNFFDDICGPEYCEPVDRESGLVKYRNKYLLTPQYVDLLYDTFEGRLNGALQR